MAPSDITFNDAVDGYDKVTARAFHFSFSSNYTEAEIKEYASYYTQYFTVAVIPAANGSNVTITLVEDAEINRRTIGRLFSVLQVANVTVNGTEVGRDKFVSTYIML